MGYTFESGGKYMRDPNAGICEKLRAIGYDAKKESSQVERVKKLKKAYDEKYITIEEFERGCWFFEKTNDKGNHEANKRRRKDLKNLKAYASHKAKPALTNGTNISKFDVSEEAKNINDAYMDLDTDIEECIEDFLYRTLELTQKIVEKIEVNENFLVNIDEGLITSFANNLCEIIHIHNLYGYEYASEENSPIINLGNLAKILVVNIFDEEEALLYIEKIEEYMKDHLDKY